MSEHLLIDLNQLYKLYSAKDIVHEYYGFCFLPKYNTIDCDILYDIINCLTMNQLNDLLLFLYKQWSLLQMDPEVHTLPTAKRRHLILNKQLEASILHTKEEFNIVMSQFIDQDKVLGIYVINQLLKFLYPCKYE